MPHGSRPAALLAAIALGFAMLTVPPAAAAEPPNEPPEAVAAGLIVEYAPGAPVREAPGVPNGASSVTVTDLEIGRAIADGLRTVEFTAPEPADVAAQAAEQLQRDPDVIFAEPDWVITLDSEQSGISPSAVQASPPWGLDRIDQRLGRDGFYNYGTTGAGVDVYVIDSGIHATHNDFGGRVTAGANFYPGLDNTSDCSGHGTHVAGTIGGSTYGVAKGATLIPIRVFDCVGGTLVSTVVDALNWVTDQHTGARPAVVNMSLGGGGSTSLDNAVTKAINAGITVVVASGNDEKSACNYSPARVAAAITVNSSTISDEPSWFTNFGSCTDLYAPGSGIVSTWWTSNSATATASGTSMAAPHVAGAAARILQRYPHYTPAQVESAIIAAATPVTFNAGVNDANRLLYANPADLPPDPPASLAITAARESLQVTWTAPVSVPAPTYYEVEFSDDSVTWVADDTVTTTATIVAGPLAAGTPYWVRVRSVTDDDSSSWAIAGPVSPLPASAPASVTGMTATVNDSSLDISWTPPADDGGRPVLYYEIEFSDDGSTWIADDTTVSTSTSITGLTNGTAYSVRVRAVNAMGSGDWASLVGLSARLISAPTAPQSLSASGGNGSISLTWSPPADNGGRAITSYVVEASTDDSTWALAGTVGGTSMTITGLVNATTYSVRVAAVNAIGQGAWAQASATPQAPPPTDVAPPAPAPAPAPEPVVTAPGAPTLLTTTAGDRTIAVTWQPSDDTGGDTPTGFTVELRGDERTMTRDTETTSTTIADLVNGIEYQVRVAATNSAGTGDWSSWSEPVKPLGPASAPTSVDVVVTGPTAALTWAPPESDGGSPISGYSIDITSDQSSQTLTVTGTSATLVDLAPGVDYSARIAAITEAGPGAWSDVVTFAPQSPPLSAPRAVTTQRSGNRITVTWRPPRTGEVLRYRVSASLQGKRFRSLGTTSRTKYTLRARGSVTIRVAAIGPDGRGPWSVLRPSPAGRSGSPDPAVRTRALHLDIRVTG